MVINFVFMVPIYKWRLIDFEFTLFVSLWFIFGLRAHIYFFSKPPMCCTISKVATALALNPATICADITDNTAPMQWQKPQTMWLLCIYGLSLPLISGLAQNIDTTGVARDQEKIPTVAPMLLAWSAIHLQNINCSGQHFLFFIFFNG